MTVPAHRPFPALWLIALVLLLAGLRLLAAGLAGLTEDEAYYRLWALNPEWGYLDHPPMVAWWIWAGLQIFGDNALGLRAPAIVAGVLGTLVLWRTAFVLTGSVRTANRAALWLQATFLIGIGGLLMTPDAPVVLFWGLALWAVVEWRARSDARWFLAVGLFAGLGLLSKYSMLFFGAGLVLWLAVERSRWSAFASPYLWVGGAIAIVLATPVVIWNANHEWVSFAKQFGRAAADEFTFRYIGEFFGGVALLLNPFITLYMLRCASRVVRLNHAFALGLILLTSAPFLLYLFYHMFHDRVQANWPAPLFPGFVLMAAIAAETALRGRFWPRFRLWVAPVGIGLSLVLMVHAVSPLSVALGRKDPILRTTAGWEELAHRVQSTADSLGEGNVQFIATTSYVLTAEFAFHLRDQTAPPVTPLLEPERYLNGALTPLQDTSPEHLKTGLYVVLERRDGHDLDQWFREATLIGTVPRLARNHVLEQYNIYRVVR